MHRGLGILVSVTTLLAACGSGDDNTGASGSSSGQGGDDVCTADRAGGSLTVAAVALGQSLDPYSVGGGSAQTGLELVALYDSLLRFDESTGEFVGQLAESIEPNDDASEWTLTLREGIEFGNGDPMDAEAVKASIERHLDPAGESRMKGAAEFVERIEVVDPLTVRFVLTAPWGYFPLHLSAGGGAVGALGMIQNVELLEERGADAFGRDSTGGGAGPYEVTRWAPPEEVVLEAKDDWWGGPVCIQELRFTALDSGQARLDALRTGEVDMAVQHRDPVVAEEAKAEFDHVTSIYHAGFGIGINHADPELADVRTRRALALAIDPEVVDERAFGGQGMPWNGLVHPDSVLLEGTDGIPYDPEEAGEIVDELKAEGYDLSFEFLGSDQAADVEGALAVEAMLDAVGFDITTRAVPTPQLVTEVNVDRNFELGGGGQVGSEATLFASLYRFHGDNPANPYGVADPDLDAALDRLREARGVAELQAAVDDLQTVWNDLVPSVVLTSDEAGWYWRDGIGGLAFTRGITPLFDQAYVENP